jgi:RNA polymerase sigma-54 factor
MKFKLNASAKAKAKGKTSTALIGALKLAHLAEMPEEEFAKTLRELEGSRFFDLLKTSGAVNLAEFPSARYAARRYAGYGLKLSGGGIPELADGTGDLVALMQGIGQEKFEACFLRDAVLSDVERAEECDITIKDAERLRDYVNRAFIQAEFEGAPEAPAAQVYSAVAGVEIENGAPVLAFFNREIWKGRYKVDQEKLDALTAGLPQQERQGVEKLVKRLEFADKRKTTLYRALETLLNVQAEYLTTGDPGRRRPVSQKTLAGNLEVHPSVMNRLVSNKSIQLPWGTEAPMDVLLPSAKAVNLERLYALAAENPGLSDEGLKKALKNRYGVELSRRSVAQYRKDLSLAASGQRPPEAH